MGECRLRMVFMGTPTFAVPSLDAVMNLRQDGLCEAAIVGVITQPDRPAGRGRRLTAPPVKAEAIAAGLPVFQPESLRRPEGLALLESLAPDLIVVAAFAQILPRAILKLPRYGSINVHASLLPHYRGAAPISAAIRDGRQETGVSIMLMEAGLDTGPILSQVHVPIGEDDTTESLTRKLAEIGARELRVVIPPWVRGEIQPSPQDSSLASMTRPLRKEDGRIDWNLPSDVIVRHVRAMFPWPGATTTAGGNPLKVLQAKSAELTVSNLVAAGTVRQEGNEALVVTRDGAVRLLRVQPAGRKPMSGVEWLRGFPAMRGTVLGDRT